MKTTTITLTLLLLTNGVRSLHADYRQQILKDRPAVYWCFDEAAGLTARHAGRDFRLTDVHGKVIHDIVV